MKISPASEFRPYVARFVLTVVFGVVLGAVGAGFLLYYGIAILVVLLGSIATTRDPKKRVTLWGALCGLAVGCFGMWGLLGVRF